MQTFWIISISIRQEESGQYVRGVTYRGEENLYHRLQYIDGIKFSADSENAAQSHIYITERIRLMRILIWLPSPVSFALTGFAPPMEHNKSVSPALIVSSRMVLQQSLAISQVLRLCMGRKAGTKSCFPWQEWFQTYRLDETEIIPYPDSLPW